MSGNDTQEMISISPNATPESKIVTEDSDSNEPAMPFGFARQLLIIPPSLSDLKRRPILFNILATTVVVNPTEDGYNENYSPQSPELLKPSPISTSSTNLSTIDVWETPQTTTADNTFYSADEPRRVYWTSPLDETFHSEGEHRRIYLLRSPSRLSSPRGMKRKVEMGMPFPKKSGESQHVCKACGQKQSPNKGRSRTVN